ncbi:MAG: prepilin-type N-terminal cleavage/methylation domain-containing protein [Thermodesulfovibrionia bacterium]|nr:prepilin-type N-terminal cleavage/methylation domain-containing protein [Thermodesulfovibrionia bacterium]
MKNAHLRKSSRSLFTVHPGLALRSGAGCSLPNGFTLLEVLLSLTLLTIILGAAYSSFFTIQRAIERFTDVSLKYQDARTALDLMQREIEGALLKNPMSSVRDNNDKTTFIIEDRDIFGKTTSRLHLTAFSFKGSGINTISYFVQ